MTVTKKDFIKTLLVTTCELETIRTSLFTLINSLVPSEVDFLTPSELETLHILQKKIQTPEAKKIEDYTRNQLVLSYHNNGMTYSEIANKMTETHFTPKQGGEWTRYVVKGIVNRFNKRK